MGIPVSKPCAKCKNMAMYHEWLIKYTLTKVDKEEDRAKAYKYAIHKAREIENIVGVIDVQLYSADDSIDMTNELCNECYSNLDLYALPDEWGFETVNRAK